MDKIEFNRNIEELVPALKTTKNLIAHYLKKNFKADVHYTKNKGNNIIHKKEIDNKINYEITESVFELILN